MISVTGYSIVSVLTALVRREKAMTEIFYL